MQRSTVTAPADRRAARGTAEQVPATSGGPVAGEPAGDGDSVVVHVQLRPRRGATRRCLAALAALAAEHDSVGFGVTGLSKDERIVRVTVGVDLGPRAGVAKFSPQAQAAYAFVSAMFTSLYDHMPVYAAEPSAEERAAATSLLEVTGSPADVDPLPVSLTADWGERIPA